MPARRALLIGSKTGDLTGVDADVDVLGDVLRGLGFDTRPLRGAGASADGIVAAYRDLVEDTAAGDAALVFYSGHGARQLAPEGLDASRWLQYILPTDIDDVSGDRARCVLAEELSLLQLDLTGRTTNVTVILDCCHAARMSRDPHTVPRARTVAGLPVADLARRWSALRAEPRLADADGNRDAVRVVACAPDELAFEKPSAYLGGARHGVLTAALVRVLREGDPANLTWREVRDLLRRTVPEVADQRPGVEGPVDRLLFSTDERDGTGVRPVRVVDGVAVLDAAALFGSTPGDVYALVPPAGAASGPEVRAVVDRIVDGRAVLTLTGATAADLPPGAAAWPVDVALGARPVAVLPTVGPARSAVVAELARTVHVRVVDDPQDAMATVVVDGDAVSLLDSDGAPLYRDGVGVGPAQVAADVRTLARAAWVRGLASGTDDAVLPADVDVSWYRVPASGDDEPLEPGAHLFVGDRVVVTAHNRADEIRYVSMIDVGLTGAVTILSSSEPEGVTLAPDDVYELGRRFAGGAGLPLGWSPRLPADRPRSETVIAIVADAAIDGLDQLGQSGVVARSGTVTTALGRLLEDVAVGRRGSAGAAPAPVRYRVIPFDLVLHPGPRPAAGPPEPPFAIDDRVDDSVRLVLPAPTAEPPARIALRLAAWTAGAGRRVHTLVVPAGAPVRASTVRPGDDLLLEEGPVGHLVDVAVWVDDDRPDRPDLPVLLAADGIDTVTDGSAGAVAAAVDAAAQRLAGARGLLRTTLLAHDRYGTGDGARRYPAAGLYRATDASFAVEVRDPDVV